MKKALKLIGVVVGILILSALLTPAVHSVLGAWFRFEKIFNRLVMILMVSAALFFVLKHRSRQGVLLESEAWREYGFDFSAPWRRLFWWGFGVGVGTVIFLAVSEVVLGPRYWRVPILVSDVVQRFIKGMLSGFTVGIIEEFFFRGFIFVRLRRKMGLILALALTNIFYSLTHFFDNGMIFIPPNPSVGDAFRLLFGYLEPMLRRPMVIFPEFVGLFLYGLVLNLAFIRTGSLFLAIGIHAGSVFMVKSQYSFVRQGPGLYHPAFGSSPAYYDGPFEWLVLLILAVVVWQLSKAFSDQHRNVSRGM